MPLLFARIASAAMSLWMTWIAIQTSLESNLFEVWRDLVAIPWMAATLWDFYFNLLLIFAWVCWRERSWGVRGLWLVLFAGLGSIASAGYLFLQLMALPAGSSPAEVLRRKP